MAEFFKYADRSADDYINWGEVGKNVSNMLTETYKLREERKKTLDDETNALANDIANSPLGEHRGLNDAALDLGSNAANYLLMQTKLFKSGQLSEKDYVRNRQKLGDGVKGSYGAIKNYQAMFDEKMKRYKNGESAGWELESAERAEGFADFSKSGFFINPTTGEVNVAMKEEKEVNGQKVFTMSGNPSKTTSVNALNAMILGKWNKYDFYGRASAFTESIGDKLTAIRKVGSETRAGSITELLDPTKDIYIDDATKQVIASFKQAETNAIDAMLANDFDRLSLITDHMKFKDGKQYGFAYTEEDAKKNPNKIFMVGDPKTGTYKPQFTQQQIDDSNQWVREGLRAQYDKKEKIDVVIEPKRERPQQWENEAAKERDMQAKIGKQLGLIAYGNPREVEAARSYLESLRPGTTIDRNGSGLTMYDKDGNAKTISFSKDGKDLTAAQIGTSGASYFINGTVDADLVARNAASAVGKRGLNKDTQTKTAAPRSTKNPAFEQNVRQNAWVVGGDVNKTISQLAPYAKYGVVVNKDPTNSKGIVITLPNKTEVPISLDISSDDQGKVIAEQIQGLIINNAFQKNRDNDFPMGGGINTSNY